MKIINFIKSLLPRMEKDQILEDMRVTIDEFDKTVSPNFQHASDFFRSNKFRSDANKELSDLFYRKFEGKGGRQPNFISEVARRLPFLKENAEFVLAQIEELLEKDIIAEGLTAKKAILIRAASQLSFISRFSSDLLNVVYVNEASACGADIEESMRLAPAVVKHVQSGLMTYASYVSDYGIPGKEFQDYLKNVPEIVLSSRSESSIVGMYNEKDIDPFTSGYVSNFTGNPIYTIRLVFAEWQAGRYKANRETKRMLELRLLHLKLLQEKKNDPKIENEINYIQSRVDKLQRYLREVEDSLEQAA